jgi:type I restriction enzyme, S subunit
MSNYEQVTLNDILLETRDGAWGSDSPDIGLQQCHIIRGTDFPASRLGDVSKVPIRYLPQQTISRRTLRPGDILIETAGGSKDHSTGRTLLVSKALLGVLGGPATCASFARFLRIDTTKADPRFIYWYLQDLHASGGMWEHQVQHTGVARFQYTRFASTHVIPLPSRRDQGLISGVLEALDDKIGVNDRLARTARRLAHAHLQAAVEFDDAGDVELSSIVKYLSRGVTPRYTEDESQLRILNQKCIRDGRVISGPSRRTLQDKVPAAKLLKLHDVLVNSTGIGTLGRVARWTKSEACTTDSHVTIVRFDEDKVDPVCAGFAMLRAEPEIEMLGEGSTGQTELSRAQLSALRITVPSRRRVAKLRPILDVLEMRGDAALEESLALAELRDTLLPKLMSGKIRVRDAERAVEDVML